MWSGNTEVVVVSEFPELNLYCTDEQKRLIFIAQVITKIFFLLYFLKNIFTAVTIVSLTLKGK